MYKEPGTYTKLKNKEEKEIKFVIDSSGTIDDKAPTTSTDKVWSIKKINDEFSTKAETKKVSSDLETVKTITTENNKKFNMVFLHRGALQLAPENTLPSLYEAKKIGLPFCEIDIRCSSDGHLVVFHDGTVDRITDGTGNIRDLTLQQIKSLTVDVGSRIELYPNLKIATLDEALKLAKDLDIKLMLHLYELGATATDVAIKKLYNLIAKYEMTENVIVSGVNTPFFFLELRKLNKTIPISYVMGSYNTEHFAKVKELMPCYYGILGRPPKAQVEECHRNGIKVVCDSCYNIGHYNEVLENGVDLVLSDIVIGGKY